MSDNTIKSPAMSLANILTLKEFHCDNNRLHVLPPALGNLTRLEVLSVKANELDSVPETIINCEALRVIDIKDNHVRRLPSEMGTMKSLEVLNVTANSLKTLPFSLGFCKTLKTLLVSALRNTAEMKVTFVPGYCRRSTILWKILLTIKLSRVLSRSCGISDNGELVRNFYHSTFPNSDLFCYRELLS